MTEWDVNCTNGFMKIIKKNAQFCTIFQRHGIPEFPVMLENINKNVRETSGEDADSIR